MVGRHHRFNGEGQGSLACLGVASPWGCKELDTTWWLNNKSIKMNNRSININLISSAHFWRMGFSVWETDLVIVVYRYKFYSTVWLFFGRAGSSLKHMRASTIVARGFRCPLALWILVPQLGIKLVSLALEGEFLTTRPPGKSLVWLLKLCAGITLIKN